MNKNDYIIRFENKEDYRQTENLVREAFWNVYRPGCLEHYVLHCLRSDAAFVPELSFVMERAGQLIGQIIFVRAEIKSDDGRIIPILTMGPIGILPSYQRQGYGKSLLDFALARAASLGYGAVCMEGDIRFYVHSGFQFAAAYGIRYHGLPSGADASFFLCREIIVGYLADVTGEYATPQGYLVDAGAADLFDKNFPPKKKLKLATQLFEF